MNYRQLQASLKGHTSIKLNSKASVLQAEYDRLFLDGSFSELTCELPTVAPKTTAPTVKHQHKAQAESELKRQLSQAPRHRTPVADKYVNKKVKATVEPIKKVSCTFSKTHDEHFINPQHTRFTKVIDTVKSTLKTDTERQALNNLVSLTEKVVSISNAANNILKGFNQAQAKRNNIKPIRKVA